MCWLCCSSSFYVSGVLCKFVCFACLIARFVCFLWVFVVVDVGGWCLVM